MKLGVWIQTSIDARFRSLIQQKYQKFERGMLSYEVEMALRHWLALHTNTQTDLEAAPKPNPTPRVMQIFNQVKAWLLSHHYFELLSGQQIPRRHLEEAIISVRGSDPRTIEKWLRTFHKMKLVKPITSASWEIM